MRTPRRDALFVEAMHAVAAGRSPYHVAREMGVPQSTLYRRVTDAGMDWRRGRGPAARRPIVAAAVERVKETGAPPYAVARELGIAVSTLYHHTLVSGLPLRASRRCAYCDRTARGHVRDEDGDYACAPGEGCAKRRT